MSSGHVVIRVVATRSGFELGSYEEDTRGSSRTSFHDFEFAGGLTTVSVFLERESPRDRTYYAIALPEEPIRSRILMPDGRRADQAGARVSIECDAVCMDEHQFEEFWREIPVEVEVRLKGYETLRYDVKIGDPLPPRVMVRKHAP